METVVKIENLVKRYKELLALDHLNLTIQKGEIFGLLGPNGSGNHQLPALSFVLRQGYHRNFWSAHAPGQL